MLFVCGYSRRFMSLLIVYLDRRLLEIYALVSLSWMFYEFVRWVWFVLICVLGLIQFVMCV